jgi:hypothetical protein
MEYLDQYVPTEFHLLLPTLKKAKNIILAEQFLPIIRIFAPIPN